jgi:putative ABC transport system permease protein
MTPNALGPIQVEMRAVAKSLDADIRAISAKLATEPRVQLVEPFAAANVVVAPGSSGQVTARLFAVDPGYFKNHPWLRVVSGSLGQGALLSQSVQASPGFESAKSITISLPGDAPALSLSLPVGGIADLRQASTWFSIPYGEVQGDIATVPRAVVIDYETFERAVLPVLRAWANDGGLPPFDPGSDELPSASLEAHVTIDHATYPADPGQAEIWSGQLQHVLSRLAGSFVIVADNAVEVLTESRQDATNAKILFLLLGIPGVLVAGALGLIAAATLVEAHRREEALLRMRGATYGQIARLATAQAAVAGIAGSALGLIVAALAVSAASGRPVWQGVSPRGLLWSALLAVAAGALTYAVRVIRLRQASRQSEVFGRRLLDRGWSPIWRRGRLDLVAIGVGIAILAVNFLAGGLRRGPVEPPAVALSFYVLLAPLAIWFGTTLLAIRGLLALLAVRARPERHRLLPSWQGASLRWLGRRPAHTARALAIGALAVAFGTEVLTFTATYQTAKEADARASIGSDLNLTPGDPRFTLPPLGPEIAAVSPIRVVPARVDTDRKIVLTIDLDSYAAAVTSAPRMLAGEGIEGLAKEPKGALINSEIAESFELGPGDMVPLTVFPDDYENASDLELRVLGVYSSFPPMSPNAEVVTTTAAIPRISTVAPDFYLARVAPGHSPRAVATSLRYGPLAQEFTVQTITPPNERGLTALNLVGLGAIESIGASLVAAIGVAVLGAFLILERRREFAILHTIGADTRQILTGPALEGTVVVLGSLAIGMPVGLGLGILAVQILGLFFSVAPPLLTIPAGGLIAVVLFMVIASTVALGAALIAVNRVRVASVLREL